MGGILLIFQRNILPSNEAIKRMLSSNQVIGFFKI
jgi:hypothetical protein